MKEATNAVRAIRTQAFASGETSGPIRKAIFALLAEHAQHACTVAMVRAGKQPYCGHGGRCDWISVVSMALLVEETGWGFSTMERAIRQLSDDGWILVEQLGKARMYRFNRAKMQAESRGCKA